MRVYLPEIKEDRDTERKAFTSLAAAKKGAVADYGHPIVWKGDRNYHYFFPPNNWEADIYEITWLNLEE